jgi:allantoicase
MVVMESGNSYDPLTSAAPAVCKCTPLEAAGRWTDGVETRSRNRVERPSAASVAAKVSAVELNATWRSLPCREPY